MQQQLATDEEDLTSLIWLTKQCQQIKHLLKKVNWNKLVYEKFAASRKPFFTTTD